MGDRAKGWRLSMIGYGKSWASLLSGSGWPVTIWSAVFWNYGFPSDRWPIPCWN